MPSVKGKPMRIFSDVDTGAPPMQSSDATEARLIRPTCSPVVLADPPVFPCGLRMMTSYLLARIASVR